MAQQVDLGIKASRAKPNPSGFNTWWLFWPLSCWCWTAITHPSEFWHHWTTDHFCHSELFKCSLVCALEQYIPEKSADTLTAMLLLQNLLIIYSVCLFAYWTNIKARLKEVLVLFIERIQQIKCFNTSASVLQKQKFSKMLEPKYLNALRVKGSNLNV